MPIPSLDPITNSLPPYLRVQGKITERSPYKCSISQLCGRYATSVARVAILDGLLNLRSECRVRGIVGFLWLGGSFLEDIETLEQRDPNDIDAVTFIREPITPAAVAAAVSSPIDLRTRPYVKVTYRVDHSFVELRSPASKLMNATYYWYGLYSHRRNDLWKGMLEIQLESTSDDDDAARRILEGKP